MKIGHGDFPHLLVIIIIIVAVIVVVVVPFNFCE
jgi:hypothetical protein